MFEVAKPCEGLNEVGTSSVCGVTRHKSEEHLGVENSTDTNRYEHESIRPWIVHAGLCSSA